MGVPPIFNLREGRNQQNTKQCTISPEELHLNGADTGTCIYSLADTPPITRPVGWKKHDVDVGATG
jgi:hypothetical protein